MHEKVGIGSIAFPPFDEAVRSGSVRFSSVQFSSFQMSSVHIDSILYLYMYLYRDYIVPVFLFVCTCVKIATWLILPVVIRSSQRLSHACLSINLLL